MARKILISASATSELEIRKALDKLASGLDTVSGVVAAPNPATIAALTFSNPPTQAECEALRDATAGLATAFASLRAAMADQELIGD